METLPSSEKFPFQITRAASGRFTLRCMDKIRRHAPIRWFLREWRDHFGLTQEQLAERMDTTRGQVNKLENGKQRMNDDLKDAFPCPKK